MKNEPFHILLADDDEADRLVFKEAFSELKIKTIVSTVNNGIQLMEWLHMNHAHLPDFVFLDLNMPRKNGLECLKEIKSNEKLKDIFIAIYSTSDNEKDMEETFINGANIYITKPNDFNVLKQLLHKAVVSIFIYEGNTFNKENFFATDLTNIKANFFSEVEAATIEQFVIALKIERIKELIIFGEETFSEIAHKLHYSSAAHLSTQFKKATGLTPSHFKALKEKEE